MSAASSTARDLARLAHVSKVAARHLWIWKGPRARRADFDGPNQLREMFEEMGGTFVKLGQMLALQPDVLPPAYCNALYRLLDRVPPFEFAVVRQILEQEHGRTAEESFERLDPEPLATASIGQVHVGWVDGHKVAVKVRRPEAETQFGSDVRLMGWVLWWLRLVRPASLTWLTRALDEFIEWTREELDFRQEARYTEQLRYLARRSSRQRAPRILRALTTERVLVTEFLEGTILLHYLRAQEAGDPDLERLEPRGFERKRFASNVIDNFLGDAFSNGFYHADLHPGNLLILDDNVVGYIDFGITGVMSAHGRRHLVVMTLALATGDMDLFSKHFLQLATFEEASDPVAFRTGLDELAEQWYGADDSAGPGPGRSPGAGSGKAEAGLDLRVNFTRIMVDLLTLSRKTHLLPERDIVKYIRSTIAIDGLVTRFEPDFHVGSYLAERCAGFLVHRQRLERLAPDRLLDWAASQGKLLRDGPDRLTRWAKAQATATAKPAVAKPHGQAEAWRVLYLGALSLCLALMARFGGSQTLSLWTVEMVLLGSSVLILTVTVLRLVIRTLAPRRTLS